jgi:hypothetical protein
VTVDVYPREAWHEDMGPVIWWKSPIDEPPYVGTPLDLDWPGHHTHFTLILAPASLLSRAAPKAEAI